MKKIGVLGGTFDPVHNEHVVLAEEVIKELQLDKLIVMPTFRPPHKTHSECASANDRLNMAKLAFSSNKIEVSDYEIAKQGTSYTYLTIEMLNALYPNATVYFIVGGDMLTDFKTWKEPQKILNGATLAAFMRSGFNSEFEKEELYFEKTFGKKFVHLNYQGKNLSSTKIRIYKMFGFDISGFVPKKVADYIVENDLYPSNGYIDILKTFLPEKRLIHTANVITCALDKAKPLGLNRDDVFTACALHDIAKYINPEKFPDCVLPENMPKPVVHAYLGEYFAREKLGIKNQDILNAIKYHTSGRANMSNLEKLVFVADMIEEGRTYDGVEKLRQIYNIDFEECFKECLKEEMQHLKNKQTEIFYQTVNAYNYYMEKGE